MTLVQVHLNQDEHIQKNIPSGLSWQSDWKGSSSKRTRDVL